MNAVLITFIFYVMLKNQAQSLVQYPAPQVKETDFIVTFYIIFGFDIGIKINLVYKILKRIEIIMKDKSIDIAGLAVNLQSLMDLASDIPAFTPAKQLNAPRPDKMLQRRFKNTIFP